MAKPTEEEWEDVETNFFQFQNVGDSIEGELIDKGSSDQYGFGLYTITDKEGEQVRFHGASHLDELMLGVKVGDMIHAEFVDVQKRPKGDMKIFTLRKRPAKKA